MENKDLNFTQGARFFILLNKKPYAAEVSYDEPIGYSVCEKCNRGLRDIRVTPLPNFFKHLKIEPTYDTKLKFSTRNTDVINLLCCPSCGVWYQGAEAIGIIGEEPKINYEFTLYRENGTPINILLTSEQYLDLRYLYWNVQDDLGIVLANIIFDKEGWIAKLLEGCAKFDKRLNAIHGLFIEKRVELAP